MSVHGNRRGDAQVPKWLWWSAASLLVIVLGIGLVLAAALLLGWRSPTPHRAPDWSFDSLVWTQDGDGNTAITDDSFYVLLRQPYQRAWAVADRPVADFEAEVVVRSVLASEDVSYGLLFRYQDQANYYLFAVGGDGYYTVAVVQEGELTPLRDWQEWPHIRRGTATNRLRVRCEDTHCQFHINDEFAAETSDDSFRTGHLGLWAETFSDDDLEVIFERVRLWSSR